MATIASTPIRLDYLPAAGDLELRIQAGACRLKVSPGGSGAWITGSYHDPSGSVRLDCSVEGHRAVIQVGRSPADVLGVISGIPELDLELGKGRPFALSIAAGASENHLELGGLPLTRLEIGHGAGSVAVTFSEAVPTSRVVMKFGVGAGKTDVYGLGNVDFEDLAVEGGAASCLLDFSGEALQSGAARIATAMASVEVRVPEGLSTEVTSDNLLGRPHADAGFARRGGCWLNHAAAVGKPVQLRIRSAMVMGSLRLSTIA